MKLVVATFAASLAAAPPAAAQMPDMVFGQFGRASDTTSLTAGAMWEFTREWRLGTHGTVVPYGEVSLGHWRADADGGRAAVTHIGVTPTFRYFPSAAREGWFIGAGIGLNVLTPIYRTRDKRFSTAFNFGDHIAVGYRMKEGRRWEWLLRLQHFSNAGIKHPNPGENFVQLRVSVPLQPNGL